MLKNLKNNATKITAFVLAIIMVLGIIPMGSFGTVFASNGEGEGSSSTLPEITGITVTPYVGEYDKNEHPAVTVEGTVEGDVVTYSENGGEFVSECPQVKTPVEEGEEKSIVVKVERVGYNTYTSDAVTPVVSKGKLTNADIVVTPYANKVYDGTSHYSVEVSGTVSGDKVEYKVDNGEYSENKPMITTPGSQTIIVRVTREYYDIYESDSVVASVVPAELSGITATGYSAEYDGGSHGAVVSVNGLENGDVVTYSATKDGTYSIDNPPVKDVKDSGTYYVKVHRDGGLYNDAIIPVAVEIRKKTPTLSFKNGEKISVYYNESRQYTNIAEADCKCKPAYSIVSGNASVDENGVVTYTSVGTIKVRATIAECDNYKGITKDYELNVTYVDPDKEQVATIEGPNGTKDNWYSGKVTLKAPTGWKIKAVGSDVWGDSFVEEKEGWHKDYQYVLKDGTGNITEVRLINFGIDKTAPTFKVVFDDKYTDPASKIINILTFGIFCKEEVVITVNGDDGEGSGVQEVRLFKYAVGSENGVEVPLNKGTINVFTIEPEFEGTLKVQVIDNVNNSKGQEWVNKNNSNYSGEDKVILLLEQENPEIFEITNGEGKYPGDIVIKFKVKDSKSGLASVDVKVNETSYADEKNRFPMDLNDDTRINESREFEINTANADINKDGTYHIEIIVTDNAGNKQTEELQVGKDGTAPVITDFKFYKKFENNVLSGEIVKEEIGKLVVETPYGFYCNETMYVKISAEDIDTLNDNELSSDVSKIYYKLVNKDEEFTDIDVVKCEQLVDGKYIVVEIPSEFKGQIYAYAEDGVGNKPTEIKVPIEGWSQEGYSENGDTKGYKHPLGIIVESMTEHENEMHATLTPSEKAPYKTKEGKGLYAEDVYVNVEVFDSVSGIRSFSYTVESMENKSLSKSYTITVDNDGTIKKESGDPVNWVPTTKENGSNLVTGIKGQICVDYDSNDIDVTVDVTDRAGNSLQDADATLNLNIDKTQPDVTVDYVNENELRDEVNKTYYRSDRKATIKVVERNFDASKFEWTIKKDGTEFEIVNLNDEEKWTKNGYTYEAYIPYTTDGDYEFEISCTDLASNPGIIAYDTDEAPQEFTIDKKEPTIKVEYDNNSAQNDKYFKENRTATVTIVEHNFEPNNEKDKERLIFNIEAKLNGADIEQPVITLVSSEGDVHKYTIAYAKDGDYKFDVTMTDKAGNENEEVNYGDSVAAKEFTIDTDIQQVIIGGVANGKAYPENVIPTIKFTDVNYEPNSLELHLYRTRRNEKDKEMRDEKKLLSMVKVDDINQNGEGTFDIFKKLSSGIYDQNDDGIYVLTAVIRDKAGNESDVASVKFSVNRFGSVYEFDSKLNEYIQTVYNEKIGSDIIITEYNADRLVADSLQISITRDGKPLDEVVYDVSPVINDTVPVGESGWYQYRYTIKASNFSKDGLYKITIASKDKADNASENNNYEDKGITFRVDDTAPEITSIVGLEEARYYAKDRVVKFTAFDAVGIKSIVISINGKEIKTISGKDLGEDINNYSGEFTLKEGNDQKVQIVVTDLANNDIDTSANTFNPKYVFEDEVTISTNIFVLWYDNKPLFWGSIAGTVVVLAAAATVVVVIKRKKEVQIG